MPPPPTSPADARSRAPGSARCRVLPLVPGLDRPPARRRPLPDAAAVRLVVVPDSAPPYDDERDAAGHDAPREPRRLALATVPRAVAPGPHQPQPPSQAPLPAQPPPSRAQRERAAAAGWPGQFAQVLAETLAGSRPQGQIVPWTTDQTRRRIRQLRPMLTAGVQPRVRRVVTDRPTTDVVEMTVIVGFGPRIRALAVRLERDGPRRASPGRAAKPARWVCTVIEAA
jgi:Family of unknown function (DUF6459)